MTQDTPKSPRRPRKIGPAAIAALLAGGLFQPLFPAFAAGTDAGEQISNTATATYSDEPNSTDPPINATSNTVTVTVAEVAGLTAVPAGFADLDGGAVEAGDTLQFDFNVTNIGNDATNVFFPGEDNLTTENFDIDTVEILNSAGTIIAIVPAAGGSLLGNDLLNPNGSGNFITLTALDDDDFITVRVTGTPAANTPAGADVGVTVGNTGPNNNSASTQNQPDNADATDPSPAQLQDIRTINVGDDTPVNGEREASAENSIPFASSVQPLALAQVTKVASNLSPGATGDADDDLITYDLGLSVLNASPNAAFTPEALEGTTINLDGSNVERVLVSDAIPANTVLQSVDFANLPNNWAVVFTTSTTDVPATGIPNPPLPNGDITPTTPVGALWQTLGSGDSIPSNATRIGFVYIGTANNGNIAPGTTFSPFRFTVITSRLTVDGAIGSTSLSGGQIANIAQVFGQTESDPDNEVVYDESGDRNPNNFNDDGTPPDASGTNFVATGPEVDDGVANPVEDGVDTGNNNTGTGPDGEDNVVNLGSTAGSDDILNGPNTVPGAVGPNDDNDDFTNQTTNVPAGVGPSDTFDPAAETFTNTVQNPANSGSIGNVTIEPIAPSVAQLNDDNPSITGQYGKNGDIPDGTVVTIAYDPTPGTPGDEQSAEYTWNADAGVTGAFEINSADTPVNIGNLDAGATANYTVTVDLLAGTRPNEEIPIPIVAFPDDAPGTTGNEAYTGETTNNITIDRVYTGFMKLTKAVQILDENGVIVPNGEWTPTLPNTVNVLPGYQIEYRITYENISTGVTGNGNNTLTAFDFEIVEDGNASANPSEPNGTGINNWAQFTDHEQNTSADQGLVRYFDNNDVALTSPTADPIAGTEVGRYENEVGQVDPGQTGQFQFRRRIK